MEKVYNKLVRDNIPDIIKANGEYPITRILSEEEYRIELEKKLLEEYHEVLEATGEHRLEELADMLEIIKFLARLENATLEYVMAIGEEKNTKNGSFENRIYLETVLEEELEKGHSR